MGVTKELKSAGNGVDFPQKNDRVTIHYTGRLADGTK
jgi:FKBP-type peptidyl-prolyl cis-trans isomerase